MEELKARNIRAMWNAVNELEDTAMHPGKKKSLSTETLFIAIAAIREIAEQTRHKNTANHRAEPENPPLDAIELAKTAIALQQLKAENEQLRAVITQRDPDFFNRKCRVCGCDWNHPCNDHDYWVEDDLCSACAAHKPEGSET